MRVANYAVEKTCDKYILIRDLGPWDQFPSITNSAEEVVEQLACTLLGRRLFYIDTEGELTELVVEDGKFKCFGFPSKEDL